MPSALLRSGAIVALAFVAAILVFAARVSAQTDAPDTGPDCSEGNLCGLNDTIDGGTPLSRADTSTAVTLVFFWGVGCPHCEDAKPSIETLAKEHSNLRIEAVEVRSDPEGRRRFVDTMKRLGATAVGVPTFVIGSSYVVGYAAGETDPQLRALVTDALRAHGTEGGATSPVPSSVPKTIAIPWLGEVDPSSVSLPGLTVGMGFADGLNPCAIWVLVVLLGILLHVETTPRMLLYAGTFVVMSGVVYFVFMVAWAALFELAGLSRIVTRALGAALVGMGLLNLKDVVRFKVGPSLVIPDRVKPGLFRRMRKIAGAATTPAALAGIAALAFIVNLVELGCTLGLPAIFTRILSLRGLGAPARFAYLALYNVAYVVPLMVVVAVFIGLKRRIAMTKGAARALKGVSGLLLTMFGLLFLVAPNLLSSP